MQSFVTQELQREAENDRLRMAGYQSRIVRRRRDRHSRVRTAVGNGLVSAGERLRGCTQPAATPMARRP